MPYEKEGRDALPAFTEQLDVHGELYMGAFDGEELVGVVLATTDMRRGWINRLCVHPAYRGEGIAEELVRRAEGGFRSRGVGISAAHVEEPNRGSCLFFRAEGYLPRRDIIYFRKDIR